MNIPPLSRRDFLAGLCASLTLPSLLLRCASRPQSASSALPLPSVGLILMPMVGRLVIFDPRTALATEIAIPNKVSHSVVVNPHNPRQVLVLDQSAPTATLVDILDKKILAVESTKGSQMFSGHGCLSRDGHTLFLAEYPGELNGIGCISLRDPETLQLIKKIGTFSRWSHNLALIKNESIMVVGHRGSIRENNKPTAGGVLNFIDVKTGELLESVKPEDKYLFLNHFDLTSDETVVVSTQSYYTHHDEAPPFAEQDVQRETPLMIGKYGEKNWKYLLPDSLRSRMKHNHTIVVDRPRNRALVAHQYGRLVSVWDLRTNTPIKTFEIEEPLGISLSPENDFYVIVSKSNQTLFVRSNTLEVEANLPGSQWNAHGDGALHTQIIPYFS